MGIVNQDGAAIDKDLNVNQIEEKGGKRQGRASLIGAAFFTRGGDLPHARDVR